MNDLTFEIHSMVDGKEFNFEITVPSPVKNINKPQASAIIRALQPNAENIEILHVHCLY